MYLSSIFAVSKNTHTHTHTEINIELHMNLYGLQFNVN
jgi:hypothetical protein